MVALVKKKNADYSNNDDAFSNFRNAEKIGVSVVKAMYVRMNDKFERTGNLLNRPPAVSSEALEDSLADIIGYASLMLAYLESTKTETGVNNVDRNAC
jgi:hypothetical protein